MEMKGIISVSVVTRSDFDLVTDALNTRGVDEGPTTSTGFDWHVYVNTHFTLVYLLTLLTFFSAFEFYMVDLFFRNIVHENHETIIISSQLPDHHNILRIFWHLGHYYVYGE